MVFDFKSLYPSIIRTFQIDPLGFVPAGGADLIVAPNGAAFRREPGILPGILDDLFPRREQAKAQGDLVKSQAVKILMNSFYGVLGTPACRFHNPDIANAITGFGRELLLWSKARFEAYGRRVLYGDTDSLFVLSGEEEAERARRLGAELAERLNRELAEEIARRWRVSSRLELEMEAVYLRLVLLHARHAAAGARKRYAGLVESKGRREVVFTGMEVVRRDWTELAKQVQREMYARLFDDRPVEEYVRQLVADLRAGRCDGLLVYRKALRKDLDEYTATTPPHVAAARKMGEVDGRLISYVMTVNGPEPASAATSPVDHEHYVEKQVRPVAEPVLELLGLDFDRLVGNDSQLRLFE
jgi:DNA polymerase-2